MINMTKDQMVQFLRDYRAERESIGSLIANLSADMDAVYQPPARSFDTPRVQQQYDHGRQIDRLLRLCDQARAVQQETLYEIKRKTHVLDLLMKHVTALPGSRRVIITEIVMGGESVESFAQRFNRSESTVKRLRDEEKVAEMNCFEPF